MCFRFKNIFYMQKNEWYKQHVVDKYGEQKAETFQKRIKNKVSDRTQYKKYKEILGKEAPKSFANFQELKYNDSNEWNELKSRFRVQEQVQVQEQEREYNTNNKKAKVEWEKIKLQSIMYEGCKFGCCKNPCVK